MKQQKHLGVASFNCISALIELSKKQLKAINNLGVTLELKSQITLSSRINLMYDLHDYVSNTDLTRYALIARQIEEANKGKWKEHFRLCHGDMWVENIMVNHESKTVLIDFDKVLYFHPAFDYCYLYIMESEEVRGTDLKSKLSFFDFLVDDLINLVKDDLKFTVFDIKMCLLTVFFLKLSERDFYQKKFGYCLVEIENVLNKILIEHQ